jgi:hypothetical protein
MDIRQLLEKSDYYSYTSIEDLYEKMLSGKSKL